MFLKASLVGAFALLGRPGFPQAWATVKLPEGRLSLHNLHTEERLVVSYRDPLGRYDRGALDALDHFLRCHYTQQTTKMDLHVIEFLNLMHKTLGGNHEIEIISGFRSREYNELLIRQGRKVAKQSLHLVGKAVDIRIPRIGLDTLRQTALSLKYGGVGYYPQRGFIHLDSGRFRSW